MKLGYRRNPNRKALPHLAASHLGASYPQAVSLSKWAPPIFDQGDTGSCVGHARARGIYIARAVAGNPLPFIPSPAMLYKLARCLENYAGGALHDEGCDPVDSLEAVKAWGITPMVTLDGRFSDADPATINAPPTLRDLEKAAELRLLEDYEVRVTGKQRRDLVCQALASGYPVCIDVAAGNDDWYSYRNMGCLTNKGRPTDHYVCLTGYFINPDDSLIIRGHNSWGTNWGIRDSDLGTDGTFIADESVLQAATDIIVCIDHGDSSVGKVAA